MNFVDNLSRFGDAPALISDADGVVTYADLASGVERSVAELQALGGGERRLVAAAAQLSVPYIVAYLAALQARCPIIAARDGDDRAGSDITSRYRPHIRLDGHTHRWEATGHDGPALHPDLALLLSTSGSMGSPKLVRLSAANLQANAGAIAQFLDLQPGDRGLLSLPLHYSYGLSVLHSHLAVGASLYVTGQPIVSPGFLDAVEAARCTNMAGVPHSFALFEQIGLRNREMPDLRFMTVAGGALDPDLVRDYARFMQRRGGRFFVMYGQTEATARMAYLPPDAVRSHPDHIGIAIPGGHFELVDAAGKPIEGSNVVGELVYAGPNVMMGYAESSDDLALGTMQDRLKTGDLAQRSPEGFYRIAGRLARFSKIAGLRISHDAIEQRLLGQGLSAAVTGDDVRIQIAVEGRTSPAGLRLEIARGIGVPADSIELADLDRLPRTSTGKIDYPALTHLVTARNATAQPASDKVESIEGAFATTFFPRRVQPHDSFNSLGGDSLAHVQIALALEQQIGRLPKNWENTSITVLAARAPRPRRAWESLDPAIVLRAVAIVLVVLHHATLWPLSGGAATLLVLVGFSLARFQSRRLFAGDVTSVLRDALLRNVMLYLPIVLIYCIVTQQFLWPSLLLVGNTGLTDYSVVGGFLWTYWFVDAYAQIIVLVAGLFLIGPARRWIMRNPLAAGLIATAFALPLRWYGPLFWNTGPMQPYMTIAILYLPAFGWAIHFAETRVAKWLLTFATLVVMPLVLFMSKTQYLEPWVRCGTLMFACLLLTWRVHIPLPSFVAALVRRISAASYHIYLFHVIALYALFDPNGIIPGWQPELRFLSGLGLGLLAFQADRWLRRRPLASRRTRMQAAE